MSSIGMSIGMSSIGMSIHLELGNTTKKDRKGKKNIRMRVAFAERHQVCRFRISVMTLEIVWVIIVTFENV